jgi:hypothetical protein
VAYLDDVLARLQPQAVRCGLHDKRLLGEEKTIEELIKFNNDQLDEVTSDAGKLQLNEIGGMVAYGSLVIADVLTDVVKGEAKPKTPGMGAAFWALDKIRDYVGKDLYKGNKYQRQVEWIELVKKQTEEHIESDEVRLAYIAVMDLAKNSYAFLGFLEDSQDASGTMDQNKRQIIRTLAAMSAALERVKRKIADDARNDDEGTTSQVRSSRMRHPAGPPVIADDTRTTSEMSEKQSNSAEQPVDLTPR